MNDRNSGPFKCPPNEIDEPLIVFHQENGDSFIRRRFWNRNALNRFDDRRDIRRERRGLHPSPGRKLQGETTSLAESAGDRDIAAMQAREPPRDRETQSRSAKLPGRAAIGLSKLVEDVGDRIGRYADSGIAHRDTHRIRCRSGGDRNASAFSELHRVADQVEQNLPDANRIGLDRNDPHANIDRDLDTLGRRLRRHCVDNLFRNGADLDSFCGEIHPSRFDPRKIEHIIDQVEQLIGSAGNLPDIVRLLRCEFTIEPIEQQIGVSDDCIHRCAQFVAHG